MSRKEISGCEDNTGHQARLAEYYDRADKLSASYYAAVKTGAITLQQAMYSLTIDLQREWRKAFGRSA